MIDALHKHVHVDCRLQIDTKSWVQINIDLPDVSAVEAADQQFILDLMGKVAALAPWPAAQELPDVLRGTRLGSRQ